MRPLHTLVIPKRLAAKIFETTMDEREALHQLALKCRSVIYGEDTNMQATIRPNPPTKSSPSSNVFREGSNTFGAAGRMDGEGAYHMLTKKKSTCITEVDNLVRY